MVDLEVKGSRFKKLRETLETVEQQEKAKSEKARVCDKMLEIYKNKDLDINKKSELFIQVLSDLPDGK